MAKQELQEDVSYHYGADGDAEDIPFRFQVERDEVDGYTVRVFHGGTLLREAPLNLKKGESLFVTAGLESALE